jgi:biotin synthase
MDRDTILRWLKEDDETHLDELWREADRVRRDQVGDEVHLRGLVEFSNFCRRSCGYCGIRADNTKIKRYRMNGDEILACTHQAVELGYGTVVLQSGEDPAMTADWLTEVIRRIKSETPLAVTLSVGEYDEATLEKWREAGADRYLMRFETSNRELFEKIHPSLPGKRSDRLAILRMIKKLGYETGSGVMIGIPGQRWDDLVRDLELFRELDLDMIGVGPYIAHPDTPIGKNAGDLLAPPDQQVPNTELMTYKVVALARILCPKTNIPSTTALATLNDQGRELGLCRGANVIMPNLTPLKYRACYEIYPAKACLQERPGDFHLALKNRIETIGRRVGMGRGDSLNKRR